MQKKLLQVLLVAITLYINNCYGAGNSSTGEPKTGAINVQELLSHYELFDRKYQAFTLSETEQQVMSQWPDDLSIEIYFGTWCHDSQREVPRLLKALAKHDNIPLQLTLLDHQKSDPQGQAKIKKVKYTPTFIIYQDQREIGRIIERPKVSLIADITQFINEPTKQ